MASCSSQSMACGDSHNIPIQPNVVMPTGTITTTGVATSGNGLLTTGNYITNPGYISTGNYGNYGFGYDKSVIIGKEGDIFMDLKNMKFKVYCTEKGWVEYDIEDFSTKNKNVELNGTKETSVIESIKSRNDRKVLVEKVSKKKTSVLISDGAVWIDGTGINTINIGDFGGINNTITLGYNSYTNAIGLPTTYGTYTAGGANTITINGNLIVNNTSDAITVNSNKTYQA